MTTAIKVSLITRLLGTITFIAVWNIASSLLKTSFIPSPSTVIVRIFDLITSGEFFVHALPTLRRIFLAFSLSFLLSGILGILMGRRSNFQAFLEFPLILITVIPSLVWAIIVLVWFGIGEAAVVSTSVLVMAPFMTIIMFEGAKAINEALLDIARVFNISTKKQLLDIIFPQLLPSFFSNLRFGFMGTWKIIIIAELFGLSDGIGYQINNAYGKFSSLDVLAWTFSFALIVIFFEKALFIPLERHYTSWRGSIIEKQQITV